MNSPVVRLYTPPKPTLADPNAQIKWMFFQLEAEHKERRAASFRYAKTKYLQFLSETKAYYPELEANPRFYLDRYWEADALIRFNRWLLTQKLRSKTLYSIYKTVRRVMDVAYALRVIDVMVYHAPMFKGLSETEQRAAYPKREQEVINAAVAKWIGLASSVVGGYTPTGEGIPYRRKDFDTSIDIGGRTYKYAEAAEEFGIEHGIIAGRIKQGWTPRQAVGLDDSPKKSALSLLINGFTYQSITHVAQTFGLSASLITRRIKKGWTLEQSVGLAPEPKKGLPNSTGKPAATTVDGMQFKSLKEASEHYGIKYNVFKARLYHGWTLQEALGLAQRESFGTKVTVEGIDYSSVSEVARAYGVERGAVAARLREGYSPEQAVGVSPRLVLQKDERALLWAFENEYGCDACEMLTDFYNRKLQAVCTERGLRTLFSKWGVWPYVDDRLVMPLVVELAMLTALNVEAIKELEIDSYQTKHPLTGQPVIFYHKRRSGSSKRSEDRELHLPVLEVEELYLNDSVMEKVRRLVMLVLAITSKIRHLAPIEISRRLFIFEDVERSRKEGGRVIVAIEPKGKAGHWYRRFCNEERLYQIFHPKFNFNISRCRPTLATNMALAGADLFQIQVALGHEDIQTTATYLDERQLRPAFNKTVSEALEGISRRSREQKSNGRVDGTARNLCRGRDESGFHETLSGCGCTDPYQPSESVKKVTNYQEGTVCKYWNMCLLCDRSVVTENSLPKLIMYKNRVTVALELGSASIKSRKELYGDAIKLIDGIIQPDAIFPEKVIDNAKHLAASMDDLLVDHLIYQGI